MLTHTETLDQLAVGESYCEPEIVAIDELHHAYKNQHRRWKGTKRFKWSTIYDTYGNPISVVTRIK